MANNGDYRAFYCQIKSFKFGLCRIRAIITTRELKLADFGVLLLWRILANLGARRLNLSEFTGFKLIHLRIRQK